MNGSAKAEYLSVWSNGTTISSQYNKYIHEGSSTASELEKWKFLALIST
jgi:hypothetical protein